MTEKNILELDSRETEFYKLKWHKFFRVYVFLWVLINTWIIYVSHKMGAFRRAITMGVDYRSSPWLDSEIFTFSLLIVGEALIFISLSKIENLRSSGLKIFSLALFVLYCASYINIFAYVIANGLSFFNIGGAFGTESFTLILLIPHLISFFYYRKRYYLFK